MYCIPDSMKKSSVGSNEARVSPLDHQRYDELSSGHLHHLDIPSNEFGQEQMHHTRRVIRHSRSPELHNISSHLGGVQHQISQVRDASARPQSLNEGSVVGGSAEPTYASQDGCSNWGYRTALDPRVATPSEYSPVQVQPIEIVYGQKEEAGVCEEHEHKMMVDGDSLTLVILDCSPSPHPIVESRCSSSYPTDLSIQQPRSSSSTHNNQSPCDSCNRCFCHKTELIVRQHFIPAGDHICPTHSHHHHHHQPRQPNQVNHQQQQQQQQQNILAIESNRSDHDHLQQEHQSSTNQEELFTQRTYRNQEHQEYLHPGQRLVQHQDRYQQSQANPEPMNDKQQVVWHENNWNQERIVYNRSPQFYSSGPNYLRKNEEYTSERTVTHQMEETTRKNETNLHQDNQLHTNDIVTQQSQHSNLQQHDQTPQSQHSQQNRPLAPGKRLVKRWNWNKQEFEYIETSDEPSSRPHKPSRQPNPEAPAWGKDSHSMPDTSREYQASTSNKSRDSLSGSTLEPSWLAYRVPDIESVRSDSIYGDLLQEIQRFEDGSPVKSDQGLSLEPETSQKPVFGQQITPDYLEVNESESCEFVCRLIPTSDPSMRVEWTINGQPLLESNRYVSEFDFGVVRFKIKRCEAEDSGIYQCRAINALGEAISTASLRVHTKGNVQYETLNPAGLDKIRQLENPKPVDQTEEPTVQQAPKFITHIQDYIEKEEGESVHYECCLGPVDDPDLKTEWFFNGRPLVTGSRFHTIDDFGFIVLDIDWLFPRDTGEYVCRATNKYGQDVTRSVLCVKSAKNIILESQLDNPMIIDKLRQLEFPDVEPEAPAPPEPDKPAKFVQQLSSYQNRRQFVEGDDAHFEARVGPATDGSLTIEWFHNDKPLINGHRFKPSFDFGHIKLDILYVYPEDSGVYKCVARNASGQDSSQLEIRVTGKPALVYQSQLPKEMVGGVQKIEEMEAMWNRPPDPEEEAPPEEHSAPCFVLKPKPCTAFEGSCARFCCRLVGRPRPRITWSINGQAIVSGSRYKLTYDGMYHLIIPKCLLSDAGRVEVYARNPLGECYCATELDVKRKLDDYRGILKNSPRPWYDEQSLKVYQRQRYGDITDDDVDEDDEYNEYSGRLTNKELISGAGGTTKPHLNLSAGAKEGSAQHQIVGYMEPETPDVNLLLQARSPLIEPGDLHPAVLKQQVVMAPAPSTIRQALDSKDSTKEVEKSSQPLPESGGRSRQEPAETSDSRLQDSNEQRLADDDPSVSTYQNESSARTDQTSAGVKLSRLEREAHQTDSRQQQFSKQSNQKHQLQSHQDENLEQQQHNQRQKHLERQQHHQQYQLYMQNQQQQLHQQQQQQQYQSQQQAFDPRLPPPSPESVVHGKEVHLHTHKQTQKEIRPNKEIVREIIEKEIFEQEHKGLTKENIIRGGSAERGSTPVQDGREEQAKGRDNQQRHSRQVHFQEQQHYDQQEQEQQMVLVEDYMIPPEFTKKIQPCQALDGDQAVFECIFIGDPQPTITWYRESKMIRPSNLYKIETNLTENKSTLTIKRVQLNSNAVFTVKAENTAGSAKSSANLVVEPHPLPSAVRIGGIARQFDSSQIASGNQDSQPSMSSSMSTSTSVTTTATTSTMASSTSGLENEPHCSYWSTGNSDSIGMDSDDPSSSSSSKIIKSVRTRKLSGDQMTALIRASPEGLVAPTFLHTIHDSHCRPGELARLDARLVGTQPMEVRWLKNGQRLRADCSHKMVLEGDLYTLLILECSQSDEGNYECIASNRVGEARCTARLTVSEFSGRSSSAAGSYGQADAVSSSPRLVMSAMVTSTSSASSALTASGPHASSQVVGRQSGSACQIISGEQPTNTEQRRHFGLSRHQYNPLMGQYTSNTETQQSEIRAPKLIKRLENQQVCEGKSVTLRCQISAFPAAEVHWYKQGDKLIKPSKYFRIFKDNDETYCLKILETFTEDQGEYKCVARAANGQTQVETTAMITVIPSSPK